jgi:predicted DNA-binding transcriptional regulator AlpA
MTTDQAAAKLGVHRITLWRWVSRGQVPGPTHIVPLRREQRWTAADVERVRAARHRNGRKPGNPGTPRRLYKTVDVARISKLRAAGASWRDVSAELGVAPQTAQLALRRAGPM